MSTKGRLNNLTLIFLPLLLLLLTLVPGIRMTFPSRGISGVWDQVNPSPHLYDTYVPILWEFQLPSWNKTELTFNNWYTCLSETVPYRYSCPVTFHMNKAVLNLHIDFENLHPVEDSGSTPGFYSSLQGQWDYCFKIQRHFSGTFLQGHEEEEYLESLRACPFGQGLLQVERDIGDYNYSIRAPFTKMENNFYSTFYKNITGAPGGSLDIVASAALSNARSTLQATLLGAYYAERNRWTHALQDCRSGVLPSSLVLPTRLMDSLTSVVGHETFRSGNWELTLSLDQLSKYYTLPLTDCTFTKESALVRVLVPIRRNSPLTQSLRMMTLSPSPFFYNNKFCDVQVGIPPVPGSGKVKVMFDPESKLAYRTDCEPNELCQRSTFDHPQNYEPCASALLSSNFKDVRSKCQFVCKEWSSGIMGESEFYISRVGSDKFVLTGRVRPGSPPPVLKCHGQEGEEVKDVDLEFPPNLDHSPPGAILVRVPCRCSLVLGPEIFYAVKPCQDDPMTLESLVPWHLIRSLDGTGTEPDLLDAYTGSWTHMNNNNAPANPQVPSNSSGLFDLAKSKTSSSALQGGDPRRIQGGESPDSSSGSNTSLVVILVLVLTLIIGVQVYTLVQIRSIKSGGGGGSNVLTTWLYKVRDPTPQFEILNEQ